MFLFLISSFGDWNIFALKKGVDAVNRNRFFNCVHYIDFAREVDRCEILGQDKPS